LRAVLRRYLKYLLWIPPFLLVVLGWHHRWVCDDAFIDLHVVDNLLSGNGPVFDVSERVEAYTSPLWVALLAACAGLFRLFGVRISLEWLAVVLGLAASFFGLIFASLSARHLWRAAGAADDDPILPFGTLAVVALMPFWDYATSGLEASLIVFWLGLSFWGLTLFLQTEPRSLASALAVAVVIGLGYLVRPDLGIESAFFLFALLALLRGTGPRAACLAAAVILPLGYQLFRMGFFAALVPNTALAKEASLPYWSRGLEYLHDFVSIYKLWIPLAVMALVEGALLVELWPSRRRPALVITAAVLGGLLHGLYVVRVGGDFLHARMLLPPFLTIALPVAGMPASRFKWPGLVLVPWAIGCVLWAMPVHYQDPEGIERGRIDYIENSYTPFPVRFEDYLQMKIHWAADAVHLIDGAERLETEPAPEKALYSGGIDKPLVPIPLYPWVKADLVAYRGAMGLISFVAGSRLHLCDWNGLVDPIGSRLEVLRRGKPGHEKHMEPEWCLGRIAPPGAPVTTSMRLDVVREALACGDLADLQQAVASPLTWERFWKNVGASARFTRLRIPPSPQAARARFCG
jgi:arabinofuranosyltransferase